jgi:hypothetical protein
MLVASALAILLTWAVIAFVLMGIGALLLRIFGRDYFLVDAFWVGLATSVAFLEIWNLLSPVGSSASALIFCAGAFGLIANRSDIFHRLKASLQADPWSMLIYGAIVMLTALRASGPCDYYDTGLYGAPAVRWIMTYPVVPGLANVHGRLGINSSVFLCIAAVSQGVWKDLGFHLFTGLVVAAIWFTILPACFRLVRGSSSTSPSDWFHCILAIPIFFLTSRSKIVGTLTDEPATIACLVASGIVFHESQPRNGANDGKSGHVRLVVAASLFALAVAFKESTAVFAALAWCLALGRLWAKKRAKPKHTVCLVGALILPMFILIPWFARGIILSGYPFYPATILSFPVDWRAPIVAANWDEAAVRSWGRIPDVPIAATRGYAWLPVWFNQAIRNRCAFQLPLLVSFGGLAIALGFGVRRKLWTFYPWLWLLVPSLTGIVFWFWASPDLRFAQFAIWTAAGTLGTFGILTLASDSGGRRLAGTVLAGLLGLLVWCLMSFGWKEPYQSLLDSKVLSPLPKASVAARQTLSGLTVYGPTRGGQCWNAPLPCTPYFDETLRLRDEHSMRKGFLSEGRASYLQIFEAGTEP